MSKKNIGTMACHECGAVVIVKENERGTLAYSCQVCDYTPYAKAGDGINERWRDRLKPMDAEAHLPPPPPMAKQPPPPPKKKPQTNIWGIEE